MKTNSGVDQQICILILMQNHRYQHPTAQARHLREHEDGLIHHANIYKRGDDALNGIV